MTLGTFSRTLYGMYPLFSPTDLLCSYMNWHPDWILGCYGGGSRHSHYPESDTIVLHCPARKSSSDVANNGGFHSHWEIIVSSWSRGLFCTHPLKMIKQIESLDLQNTNWPTKNKLRYRPVMNTLPPVEGKTIFTAHVPYNQARQTSAGHDILNSCQPWMHKESWLA